MVSELFDLGSMADTTHATRLSVMSKQIEDNKQATDDLKAQMADLVKSQADLCKSQSHIEAMLLKLVSPSSGQTSRASGLNASPSGCLTNSTMTPPQPPDPPDFNQFGQRLSEFEFPVFDGTLLDCWIAKVDRFFELEQYGNEEKLDLISLSLEGAALKWFRKHRREFTDWAYVKRKLMARFGLVKGCSPPEVLPKDKEEAHQETVKNPEPFIETMTKVPDSVNDVLLLDKMDSLVKEVGEVPQQSRSGNGEMVAHQLFDQMPNEHQKDLTVIKSSNKGVLSFSHKDARVWEPGGLPTKMDHWDWFEKELKPYGESHKVATFLYSQMQVMKSNPAEFKTFDRKRSNKTLPLEDEQDEEHAQNQVMKLISSWNNRIWEPGGVLIEHDKWNWLEKCYKHGRLMRLMHWLSSMWWKESKSREFDRLSACSCVDLKTWHCVKHETQQTDFHVWHRWKNKAEKSPVPYALLELMLGLVSFQPNKGKDVVGLVPKATVLREVNHCQSNDYGTIRHKLVLVRDTSSDGYKEDSWPFIRFILKELCSAGYEWENETIKESFTIKENWFHNEPMIRGVFHLQRPPELIELHGKPNFITKVTVHWKEHPPDQFSQAFILEDKDVLKKEVL